VVDRLRAFETVRFVAVVVDALTEANAARRTANTA
jgi:hypothetical protein